MARRSNYTYEKRQKEISKQKKRDAKAEKKRLRKAAADAGLENFQELDAEELAAALEKVARLEEEPDDWDDDDEDPESDD